MLSKDVRRKCFVYIDGFNFYYRIFKNRPEWKWLDISKFAKSLRDLEHVSIRYFTAIVDEGHAYSPRRERQEKYFAALKTTPDIEIILGMFQSRVSRCRARCCEEYVEPKEKKTDVNIAVRMIDDCLKDTPDTIILISGDSDLEPAVEWIRREYPQIAIRVYLPNDPDDQNPRRNYSYQNMEVECIDLPCGRIPDCQFRPAVRISENPLKVVSKPEEWVAGYVESDTSPN